MARNKRRKGAEKKKSGHRTPLENHHRQGSRLIPPLAALPNLHLASWVNDRLPELMWCALLVTHAGRDHALAVFRNVAKWAESNRDRMPKGADLGHTGLSRLEPGMRAEVLSIICATTSDREILSSLLLFDALPVREQWKTALRGVSAKAGWDKLRLAVAHVFDHQSQLATDCRWARVIYKITSGQLVFSVEHRELIDELLGYPGVGDQQKVRPTVRAMESSVASAKETESIEWPIAFWLEGFEKTPCVPGELGIPGAALRAGTTRERVDAVAAALVKHERASRSSTDLDARTDAVFGLAAYAVAVVRELLAIGNATSILGRLGLRTLLEAHITLAFLYKKESAELWTKFRGYGSGQAKLALLKLDDAAALEAGFAGADLLEMIANEDRSAEFVEIELGQWNSTTLRQMAMDADLKAEYDAYYPWASAFAHANWGAIRNANFDLCVNALHRAHRVLRADSVGLTDVIPDAVQLADEILAILDSVIPGFPARLSIDSV